MERKIIEDPKSFFEELGGCHDAGITEFLWNEPEEEKEGHCSFKIHDLNSNSLGYPGYQERPAEIHFTGVNFLEIGATIEYGNIAFYDMEINSEGEYYRVKISCSPSGLFDIKCKKIFLIENT